MWLAIPLQGRFFTKKHPLLGGTAATAAATATAAAATAAEEFPDISHPHPITHRDGISRSGQPLTPIYQGREGKSVDPWVRVLEPPHSGGIGLPIPATPLSTDPSSRRTYAKKYVKTHTISKTMRFARTLRGVPHRSLRDTFDVRA